MNKKVFLLPASLMLLFYFSACTERQPASSPDVQTSPKEEHTDTPSDTSMTSRLVLYYFHRTVRCDQCIAMELFTGELLNAKFSEAMNEGKLSYQVINLDTQGNEHYASDFDLTYSTLVITEEDDHGNVIYRKNFDEAWEKSLNLDMFKEYLTEEITTHINNRNPSTNL